MFSEKNLVKNLKCQEIGQILCTVILLLPEEICQKKNCSKLPLKTSVKIKCLSRQTCLKLKALCMQE